MDGKRQHPMSDALSKDKENQYTDGALSPIFPNQREYNAHCLSSRKQEERHGVVRPGELIQNSTSKPTSR